MKRERFYVNSLVLEQGLGPAAIAVYVYLSRCADKEGKCFPSIRSIADTICACETTVKRALKQLAEAGLIISEPRYHEGRYGGRRRGSNAFTLVGSAGKNIHRGANNDDKNCPGGGRRTTQGGSQDASLINNNYINTRGLTPSLSYKELNDGNRKTEDRDLEELLDHLEPHVYSDEHYGNAIEAAIREMWNEPGIRINGNYVKQVEVRKRLSLLNIDCLDEVYEALADAEYVENKPQFLKVCLYNSPLRVGVQIAHQISRRVHGNYPYISKEQREQIKAELERMKNETIEKLPEV